MCAPLYNQGCSFPGYCGCMQPLTIEEEVAMLEARKRWMQMMIEGIDRRIDSLEKRA